MTHPEPSAYCFDLDGTLYVDGRAVPGVVEALGRLRARGVPVRFVTNTTTASRAMLVSRLAAHGIQAAPAEIFTAVTAAAHLAARRGLHVLAPFVPEAALEDLAGFTLAGGTTGRAPATPIDAVLVGHLGPRWDYDAMQRAFEQLGGGAELIALSRDRVYLAKGRLVLDTGPFVAALEQATGREALLAGKPSPHIYEAALASLRGLVPSPHHMAMLGDDLRADIAGAQGAGLQGWLVRTGKFRDGDLAGSDVVPDRIVDGVAVLA